MEITEIKSTLNITTVLQHYGLMPNKNNMLKCPFHPDKQPSLKIYPDTNTFNCFGCGANGDVIEFIQLKEASTGSACSKHEAIEKAKTFIPFVNNNTPLLKTKQPADKNTLVRLAILSKVATESKAGFKRTSRASDYLRQRGLDPLKTEAGYIGSEFGKSWNNNLKKSAMELGILRRSRQNTIVPKFSSFIVFFTKNNKNQVCGIYGRMIDPTNKSNPTAKAATAGKLASPSGRHFYLNGHHQGIYPHYPCPQTQRLVLTESIIDCESLCQQKNLKSQYSFISLYGTNGLTAEIKQAIKELPELTEIIIFFDGDDPGRKAARKTGDTLQELLQCKISVVDTPEGQDINSLLTSHDADVLGHLLQTSKPLSPAGKQQKKTLDPQQEILNTSNPDKITYREGNFCFTIWGGVEKENIHRLKINLLASLKNDPSCYYQDDVNLYSNGALRRYIEGASEELETGSSVLKSAIYKLKSKLESYRLDQIEKHKRALEPLHYQMSSKEQKEALAFLQSTALVTNTLKAIEKTGLVGEQKNGLLLYFLYISRLFNEPLHAIIFGKSGSGKTYLQEKISQCLPEESVRTITSLTENTLYYSSKNFWKHKVLLIEDLEGVYNAFLPLREFMSKQSITKLTTDRDMKGNNTQKLLVVEGPVCVSGATTRVNIYEDNANRSFLLHVDESPQHTAKVMEYQRKMQAGMVNEKEQEKHRRLLKNSQRLLQKVHVINPYATMLDIPKCVFKKLRTNIHYLRLIEIIAFYHQYQREQKKDANQRPYIEVTVEDIHWANDLIKDSFLRKSDELNGQLRHFFERLKLFTSKEQGKGIFYARQVREAFRMNPMTLNRYLRELEQRGYIYRCGGNRKTGFEYQIMAWDEYKKLQSGINILDEILEKVKKTAVGK